MWTSKGKKVLSSFELATMRQRFLDFVDTAGKDDANKVEQFVKRWVSLPNHNETEDDLGTSDVYEAVVDYFVKWLQKMEQVSGAATGASSHDKLNSILQLWARSSDREAPWRAQELVQRMEELDRQEVLQITSSTYNLLAETWLNSR